MVRFIICLADRIASFFNKIYIPIWLDLLFNNFGIVSSAVIYLHSNMVRFIIVINPSIMTLSDSIYIPIWLDLL